MIFTAKYVTCFFRFALAASLATMLCGCSKGTAFGDVTGKVTLDGREIAEGSIRFVPQDGKTSSAGAAITNGLFNVRVPVNTVRVEIYSAGNPTTTNKSPKKEEDGNSLVASGDYIMPKDIIPSRYHGTSSELTLEVKPGANPVNYDLKSK